MRRIETDLTATQPHIAEEIRAIVTALGALRIAGPMNVYEAAFKLHTAVLAQESGEAEHDEFVRRVQEVLGTN
jgi:hypothetical protein